MGQTVLVVGVLLPGAGGGVAGVGRMHGLGGDGVSLDGRCEVWHGNWPLLVRKSDTAWEARSKANLAAVSVGWRYSCGGWLLAMLEACL